MSESADSKKEMTLKDVFDGCMKLVESANGRRKAREDFEWKLSIAFWTMILLATQFLATAPKLSLPDGLYPRIFTAFAAFVIYLIFALGLACAHAVDARVADFYRAAAGRVLNGTLPGALPRKLKFKLGLRLRIKFILRVACNAWGQQFQVLTTLVLLTAFVFVGPQ